MNNYQKFIVPIKGMHCKSCEIIIEDELSEVKGIKKTKADWHKSNVEIRYEGALPDTKEIEAAILRGGYQLGEDEKTGFISHNKKDYEDLVLSFFILLGLYFFWKILGLESLTPNTSSGLSAPIILLIGLTAGFSTCMALVGGLILGVSARYSEMHPEATTAEKFQPHLFFNTGRILSYALFGGLLGILGSALQLSSLVLGIITILVGLVMLIMGLQLIKIFPWADNIKFTLPKSISRFLGLKKKQDAYSHTNTFILGALTFFLPCGFTQAMQIYAVSTGNFFSGAVVLGLFALGTTPGMLSIGGISSAVKGGLAELFFKFAGLAVIAFAIFNFSNGLNLFGWNSFSLGALNKVNNTTVVSDPNVIMENGQQVVRMSELKGGYAPNRFTVKKGVPVKWIIDAQAPYSCASALIFTEFNINKKLSAGENIINFTPKKAGRFVFSCSMGMYIGVFEVVN